MNFDCSYDYTDSDNYTNHDQDKVFEEADKIVKDSEWYKKHYRMITDEEINDMIKDFHKKVESGNFREVTVIDSIDLGEISYE